MTSMKPKMIWSHRSFDSQVEVAELITSSKIGGEPKLNCVKISSSFRQGNVNYPKYLALSFPTNYINPIKFINSWSKKRKTTKLQVFDSSVFYAGFLLISESLPNLCSPLKFWMKGCSLHPRNLCFATHSSKGSWSLRPHRLNVISGRKLETHIHPLNTLGVFAMPLLEASFKDILLRVFSLGSVTSNQHETVWHYKQSLSLTTPLKGCAKPKYDGTI